MAARGEGETPVTRPVKVGDVTIGGGPLAVIAGPCALEDVDGALEIARAVSDAGRALGIGVIFKGSYSKDNRSSVTSYRGPGMEGGLAILREVKAGTGLPVLTDVHTPEEVGPVAEVVDMMQIPAFLSRQTSLILAASETGRPLNIKKAQFMSPHDIKLVVEKAESRGCRQILLTERGSFHGFNSLVVDMRSFPIMASTGYPVCFDVTHSLQSPGGGTTGGDRRWAAVMARAAVAAGCHCLFMEVHPSPESSPSDKETILPLAGLESFLEPLVRLNRWMAGEGLGNGPAFTGGI
jgi:2-dehydro-3-deoxyphosphooctonate aldolase (KDO 8-P synthase)